MRLPWDILELHNSKRTIGSLATQTGSLVPICGNTGCIGLILIISTIITSSALISGDRQRANDNSETNNDKKQRDSISIACFLAAIPILLLWGYLKYFK
ncbi:DUF5316 family protein [Paenibacillus sp. GCM10027628]|uniref:DUF5316 family protein n=1 Tax=Paenibacillus sp. GCM10027628 TaxID=3273413 RepID=UPI00363CE079